MKSPFANLFLFAFLLLALLTEAQDSKKLQLYGYVKDFRSYTVGRNLPLLNDNFIHNRLNFRYYPSQNFTAAVEFRNRLFYGETVKLDPSYSSRVAEDPGFVDMSFLIFDEQASFLHTIVDRAYLDYHSEKWTVRLGRQRINWGINAVWNPNDLFNAFTFTDFDYEERPGADAALVSYFPTGMSQIDLAYSPSQTGPGILAARYLFNKWNYDWQIIAGNYNSDLALGAGWAGNLKLAGFKTEATFFQNNQNTSVSLSSSVDYSFRNGLYLLGSVLYNSSGQTQAQNLLLFDNVLSPKNLMPGQWSFFGQCSYTFSPIFSSSMAIITDPQLEIMFYMPTLTLSIAQNWQLDLISQSYAAKFYSVPQQEFTSLFLRTKWSF